MTHVVGRIDDLAPGDDDAASREAVEQGFLDEQLRGLHAQRIAFAAPLERQRCADARGLREIGEPAGQAMLGRRRARERRGDGARRGGWKYCADRTTTVLRKRAAAARLQVVV